MNIQLPNQFSFRKDNVKAYIENDILFYEGIFSFDRVMYQATYEMRNPSICYYCGCELNKEKRTIDHMYPRDLGGVSITNNLVPCCTKCNHEKDNMTMQEYFNYLKFESTKERKEYKSKVMQNHEVYRYKNGFFIPEDWYEYNSEHIYVEILLSEECIKGKRYKYICEFYKKYGHFPRPVVKTADDKLVDGFLVLLFAKNNQIDKIPCIKMENVIELS